MGDITALDVTAWLKQLRAVYAAATVTTIRCVFAMLLDDAVHQHLIPTSPAREHRRRGRRRDHAPSTAEKVFAMPEHVRASRNRRLSWAGPRPGCWSSPRRGRVAGGARSPVCNATTSTATAV